MNPRRVLSTIGLAVATSSAGCTALDEYTDSQETATAPIRFWLEEVSLSPETRESVTPIVFAQLSSDEREIVRITLDNGEYTVDQESAPPAFERLRDRVGQRTSGGETLEAYLRRADTYHRIGLADGDHIIAHPDR